MSTVSMYSQKKIAITIDDPNTYETPRLSWQQRNESIIQSLGKHNLKATLFVCGMRINDTNGDELLSQWDKANHLICNHSYSHSNFSSKSKTAEFFLSDFIKADSLIRKYKGYRKLFRFPYLKEGRNASRRDSLRSILSNHGYKNGYVTIDASDWYIDSKVIEALKKDLNTDLKPYKEYYIKHILDRANYYDSLAKIVLNKEVKHTLLIHHSLLNALFLDELLVALKLNGWDLIDAQNAYYEATLLAPPETEPCGESIIWQYAKLDKILSTSLRYPAEDGDYEIEALENYINEYEIKNNIKKFIK